MIRKERIKMKRWMVKSRRIFALLMAVMLLSFMDVTDGRGTISLAAQAADEESTGLVDSGSCGTSANWAFYSDGKLEITGTGEMSFNTAPWRDYREKISKVIIDEGITNIARNAFGYCSSLTSIVIPSTVTEIGGSALQSCSGLTSIEIPSGVTKIEYSALKGCSGLERIEVEEGNSNYDSRDNCNAIIETSSNTLITGCKNTVIPSGVTSIGCFAFYNCTSLTSIEIPAGVTSIEHEAFAVCSGLTSITIPGTVTEIGYSAFYDCSGLASIEIPDSVTSIGDSAFEGCTSLASIEIPGTVTKIESRVFEGCSGLTSIEIPSGVTEIGGSAFESCSGLERIVVAEGNTIYDSRDNCNAIIETSSNTLIAGCKNTVIPLSVTKIEYYAFYGCSGLVSITIPDSVTSIGDSAFRGCTSLTSIEIPGTVTKIGSQVFYGCSGLTSIEIPSGVTEIGYSAFYDCSSLIGIEIPSGVTKIGYAAFEGCSGLERIVVAEGNTVYDSRDNCNAMIETSSNTLITGCKNTVIPSGVTSIMSYAFYGCSGLTSIEIPSGVTEIGNSAFEGCTSLTSIEISDSVTSLGYPVFNGCSSLERIVVAEGNTVYDSRDNCNAMINTSSNELVIGCKNTVIPSGVTSIGDYAFEGCSGLKSIEIPDSVTSIGDYAFEGCNDLTIYALPGSYAESYAKNKEGISSKIMRFDVQFVSDGKIIDTQSVEYGKAAKSPEVVKKGYTFSKWDKDFTEIKEDTTVNAVWIINKYQNQQVKVEKLTITAPSKKLAAGKKVKLSVNVTPANAANKAVTWKTSNKKYATIDKNGKLTLKKAGIGKTVTVTATAGDGSNKKASVKIKIMKHAVKSIRLRAPAKTLKAGKSMTVKATVKTTGKKVNKTLTWKTSNKKYATVNKKGKVTAKKAGKGKTVTITASSTDGSNKKAKVKIKIK